MIYYILYPLKANISFLNVFRYITTRAGGAFVTSFILVVLLIPLYIKKNPIKERISEFVPEHHRKEKGGTPTSGGIIFILMAVISTLLWARFFVPFVWISIFVTLYLASMGLIDDISKVSKADKKGGLKMWHKLLLQFVLSIIVSFSIYKIYPEKLAFVTQFLSFKNINLNLGYFYIIFIMFVFIGTTNSVNLTDGLDGLSSGVYLPVVLVFMILAYVEGHAILSRYLHLIFLKDIGELAVFASAVSGGVLGFLWFNAYPGEIFMGDTGSQGLGGALAIIAIFTKQEILLAVAGGVLVIESLSVLLQIYYFRLSGGKRIFKKAPIHHHFEMIGWSEPKIVARFWILSILFAITALAMIKVR